MEQSELFWLFANARDYWKKLPAVEKKRIQSYTRKEVEELPACETYPGSNEYWRARIDAASVLHNHRDSIVHHEAAFAIGAFTYQNESERFFAVKHLRYIMRYDKSIVARHEAVEALGSSNTFCVASIGAAADMTKFNSIMIDYLDVEATAKETFSNIMAWLKTQPQYNDVVQELLQWRKHSRLPIPEGVLEGSRWEAEDAFLSACYRKSKQNKEKGKTS